MIDEANKRDPIIVEIASIERQATKLACKLTAKVDMNMRRGYTSIKKLR